MLLYYTTLLETDEERQTFADIYEKYKYDCLHLAMSICNDQALAEDAVHNAFMEIIMRKDEYLHFPCSKMRSRIVIITKNKMIDLLRKNQRVDIRPWDDDSNIDAGDECDLSLLYEQKESLGHLMDCVARLPEMYKNVLELQYFHELSYREIAAELGISEGLVSVRMVRAKKKLRVILEKDGAAYE